MPKKVILDVDTGGDDAVAMLLAGHHPALELVAVTVTHGNAGLDRTLENTLRTLAAGGLSHVPVYAGAHRPLLINPIPTIEAQYYLLPFPPTRLKAQPQHAVEFLIEYYLGPDGPQTAYLPVGPQTNLALALQTEPRLAQRIPEIITMAGAYSEGNTTPSAEFNVLADPDAARIVFSSGIPITMVGLEVTSQAEVMLEDADRLEALGTPWAVAAAQLFRTETVWFIENLGRAGGEIYDACVSAAAVDPTILLTRPMHVDIETRGELTLGRTVADISVNHPLPKNVQVGMGIDRERFLKILFEGLS
jgi:inosine-uridine nucleoside N-ribohydrolase